MTEAEWLASADPDAVLEWLQDTSDRKLRLIACACCRVNLHTSRDPVSAELVAAAERRADGVAPTATDRTVMSRRTIRANGVIEEACGWACAWFTPALDAVSLVLCQARRRGVPAYAEDGEKFADVVRDIVGNPWRPVTCDPRWLTETVVALAQAAYEERDGVQCPCMRGDHPRHEWDGIMPGLWRTCTRCDGTGVVADGRLDPDRLAILADALEEAGCEGSWGNCSWCKGRGTLQERNPWADESPVGRVDVYLVKCDGCKGAGRVQTPHPLLAHLRGPGPHWRGCWALDLVRGAT